MKNTILFLKHSPTHCPVPPEAKAHGHWLQYRMQSTAGFSALRFRDFRLFWAAQCVSFSGTWMQMTAQGWLVYELTHSPLFLGLVSAATSLPILLFSLFGGVLADRFEKRSLLLITQGLSIFPPLMIGALTSSGAVSVWHVMALGFVIGTINAFDVPARQSFLIHMVERGSLLNAIAMNSAAFNSARMIGPVVAGVLIAALGTAACFYVNAASYLAVLLALSLIKARSPGVPGRKNILRDIAEGMRFMVSEPEILKPVLLVSTISLFGLPFVSQLPVFAAEVLGMDARGLGFLMGASGGGALTAAVILATVGDLKSKKLTMTVASIAFPSCILMFSLSRSYMLSMALMFTAGVAVVWFLANANSALQLKSPDGLRGRVMSVYTLMFLGMTPIGHFLMGALAGRWGSVNAVLSASTVCLLLSCVILLVHRRAA